jgi:sulfur-oxidizing protein SoxZ
MAKPRIKLPDGTIKAGDTIEIKALIQHVMETGNRKNADGSAVPRNIIHRVSAAFEGQEVFAAELGPGISANPFLAFHMRVPGSGELLITWTGDGGFSAAERMRIEVSPAT